MIYLVEDDKSIRELLVYTLNNSGLPANGFEKPSEFYRELRADDADLIILDIMLPECDGLTMLKNLRADEKTKHIPVMMLTAKGSEYDKVVGLDMGADDYMTKPFGMMELIARVKALLRRTKESGKNDNVNTLNIGCLSVIPSKYSVKVGGEKVVLTLKEFDLLCLLLQNKGTVFTRDKLLNKIWGYDSETEYNNVEVYMSFLRKKLKLIKSNVKIKAIRGIGYKLEAENDKKIK